VLAGQRLSLALYRDVLVPTQLRVGGLQDQLADDIEPTQAREARHILVESEEEAQALLQQLAGGADFGELAQEHSIDPGSAAQGGDLGPAPEGAYVPPFDEAVWRSSVGEIVGPVATDFGYHIIEVTGEVEITADDLGPQEREQQAGSLLNRLLEERFAAAEVDVADRYGVWDPLRGEVVREGNGVGEVDGAGEEG
jgi:parvulin-like peptidyl-prolyl isomerase